MCRATFFTCDFATDQTAWPWMRKDEVVNWWPARGHVEATARDLTRKTRLEAIRHWHDCTFEVTDEAGQHVLTLPFSQVPSGR